MATTSTAPARPRTMTLSRVPTAAWAGGTINAAWPGALGESMRAALVDAQVDGRSLLVLAAWAALGTALTARTFKWE